jgi:hypothetical protein
MFLASALNRGIHPPETLNSNMFPGDDSLSFKALAKNTAELEKSLTLKLIRGGPFDF